MLYSNYESFLLQERGNEKPENPVYVEEPLSFESDTLQFPLVSNDYIIKQVASYISGYDKPLDIYISSPYNSHKIPHVKSYDDGLEWFSPDDKHKII